MTRYEPNIVRGGRATNIKGNLYYMSGRKHEAGGIDIGKNPRTGLEVEDGEVVQTSSNGLKVFSAQPILNGNSPAKLVMGGANPAKVFNAQERFKEINGINDDGTKKKENDGKVLKRELGDSPYDDPHITLSRKKLDIRKNAGKAKNLNISPRSMKIISNVARVNRVLGPFTELIQNLFPSKEQEYMEDIRNHGNNPTKGINNKMKLGGLSRKDDYGSNKKPYPSVNKKDFAGGGRSYPIPTRADAVDALRLAGLHGRSDVKAKVYKKYPDLKKKRMGGIREDYPTLAGDYYGRQEAKTIKALRNARTNPQYQGRNLNLPTLSMNDAYGNLPVTSSNRTAIERTNAKYNTPAVKPKTKRQSFNSAFAAARKQGLSEFSDIIGLVGNIGGSVASAITSRKALDDMEASSEPMYEIPAAMKTHFNIRPQISEINENTRRSMDDVTANTASSRVALQRKQRLRNAGQYAKNNLYGQKENIETQLINQDRLNRQRVGSRNIAAYNDWQNRSVQFRNAIREQKASSLNNMFSGINAGLQDMLSRIENRRNYNNTLGIYDATHPNTDKRLFRDKGVTI